MDQETANKLFHEYGCLLLLNLDNVSHNSSKANFLKQYNFNIDNQVWVTNSKFKGLKLIPPGPHYIHFSEKGQDYGEKFGFFLFFDKSQVIVKDWNKEQECFESLTESEEVAYSEGVKQYQFDANLGAYEQAEYRQWMCLSNFISKEVILKLEPIAKSNNLSREIMSSVKEQRVRDEEDVAKEENKTNNNEEETIKTEKYPEPSGDFDENIIKTLENQLKIEDEKTEKAMKHMYKYKEAYGNVFFTDIPVRKLIHGFSKEQITKSNFDKSVILNELKTLIMRNIKNEEIKFYQMFLGELQFAFILFFLGQNYEGFEQWKKMIYIL